jgi:hypothetical protein
MSLATVPRRVIARQFALADRSTHLHCARRRRRGARGGSLMSQYDNSNEDIPRFEPWLGVMASSFVPAILAMYLPPRFLAPLITLTVGLFVAGLVMLRRQSDKP